MGIFDFLTGEFIDVIHRVDDSRDTMVWRFEREGHEIKYGAKLIVREGQIADVVTPISTCRNQHHAGDGAAAAPGSRLQRFKSEICFAVTTRFDGLKMGRQEPGHAALPFFCASATAISGI